MSWFRDWFGKDYLRIYSHRDQSEAKAQVRFLARIIALSRHYRVVDVGCGVGRHLVELRRSCNQTVGVDLSRDLLSIAAQNLGLTSSGTYLLRSDMRYLPFLDQSVDLITSFFTSVGYFEDDSEHLRMLAEWHRTLKSGAWIFIDHLNPRYVASHLPPKTVTEQGSTIINQRRQISGDGRRVIKDIDIVCLSSGETKTFQESVRMFSLEEWQALLFSAQFKLEHVFGNYQGKRFDDNLSERLLLFARAIK